MGYVKMLNVSKWYDICSSIPQVFPLNDLYIGYGCRRGSSPSRPTSWIRPWSDSNTVRYYMTVFTISSPQFFWGSLLRLENALTKSIPHKYIYIFFWHKSITICPQLLCYWPSPLAVLPGPLLLTVVFFSICRSIWFSFWRVESFSSISEFFFSRFFTFTSRSVR